LYAITYNWRLIENPLDVKNAIMIKKTVSLLFPYDNISTVLRNRSTDVEVNGLPQGVTPQNCEVLLKGDETHGRMLRTHYLVNVDNRVVYLTICIPEYGDSLFGLIRCHAQIESEDGADVRKHAIASISKLCEPALHAMVA
jgi:hypothetical protein